jgi:hypothetical protein
LRCSHLGELARSGKPIGALARIIPLLAVFAGGGAACAAKGTPRGPEYTPTASPEAESPCPDEWQAAKQAREDALGAEGQAEVAARAQVAAAVLAQGECELRGFQRQPVRADTEEAMLGELRELRDRFRSAKNLFDEVLNYEVMRLSVGALARLGDLHAAYAAKLRAAPPPVDARDPGSRSEFRQELRELAEALDGEAAVAYAAALRARGAVDLDPGVGEWTAAACAGLERLDPRRFGRESLCVRR